MRVGDYPRAANQKGFPYLHRAADPNGCRHHIFHHPLFGDGQLSGQGKEALSRM